MPFDHTLTEDGDHPELELAFASARGEMLVDAVARSIGRPVAIRLSGGASPGGGELFGRFRNGEELARGGMGAVYRAFDPEIGRPVAVKALLAGNWADQRQLARFFREAQITGQLQHPNIPPLYDLAVTPDGRVYFAMKLIEGRSLAEILKEKRAEGPAALAAARSDLLGCLVKVCDALAYAHSRGVIHRDLKPANVMVGAFGEVLVMDWGIAKVLGTSDVEAAGALDRSDPEDPLRTLDGMMLGTPSYVSPEQASGRSDQIDERSDVYALGAVIYELLTGTKPFRGEDLATLVSAIFAGELEPPSRRAPGAGIPAELDRLVAKAMSRERADRYQTVPEVKCELEAYLAGRPLAAIRYRAWQRAAKWVRRNSAVSAVAAVGLAVVLAFLGAVALLLVDSRARAAELEIAMGRVSEKARRESAYARAMRLVDQTRSGEHFFPVSPARIPAYERWFREAEALVERRGAHEVSVARLEEMAGRPEGGEVDAALDLERAILAALSDLETGAGVEVGRWFDMSRRVEAARERSVDAWTAAIEAIRRVYGLELEPIEGLVPLGPDPASGLWEFEHVATAEGVPAAGSDRKMGPGRGLVLVLLPAGRFRMGSDDSAAREEKPAHDVDVPAFLVSKYEMTQAQWRRATGREPSQYRGDPTRPVEQVSWQEVAALLPRLGLRLPTEAEWEYAARAGTTGEWWTGDDPQALAAAANLADRSAMAAQDVLLFAGESWDDGHGSTAPAGCYRASPFGLHDTIGNVWEWCEDTYQTGYEGAPADGSAWLVGGVPSRVYRGGSFAFPAATARSAARDGYAETNRDREVGLRPAMSIPSTPR